jgi:hypothetical protein
MYARGAMQRISFKNRLNINQCARFLCVQPATVRRWIDLGWLTARHRPDGVWIRLRGLFKALDAHPRMQLVVAKGRERHWQRMLKRAGHQIDAELQWDGVGDGPNQSTP